MNIGLATSFIVGGLLLLSLLTLNSQVMRSTSDTSLDLYSKQQIDNIKALITHDFSRIGYGAGNQIQHFSADRINFKADVFDNGTKNVLWQLSGNPVAQTKNPDDKVLHRVGPVSESESNGNIKVSVVHFELTGYTNSTCSEVTIDKDKLRCIKVEIIYESAEPIGEMPDGSDRYARTFWQKMFVPNNLQF